MAVAPVQILGRFRAGRRCIAAFGGGDAGLVRECRIWPRGFRFRRRTPFQLLVVGGTPLYHWCL